MPITLKSIDKSIEKFTTNRDKLRDMAHDIAMTILYHCAPIGVTPDCQGSGDCTRALKLVKAMPKSWAAQMQDWLKAFTPIRVVAKNDKCEYDPDYKKMAPEDKLAVWQITKAAETPYFEFSDERDPPEKVWDFDTLVQRLIKQGEKSIEDGKVKPERVAYTKAALQALQGLKVTVPANDSTVSPAKPETQAA